MPITDPSSAFRWISDKAREITESEGFKRGLATAIQFATDAEKVYSPATAIAREALVQGMDTKPGKEVLQMMDAMPGGFEDDLVRAVGASAKAMKAFTASHGVEGLAAVPMFKKLQRRIAMANDARNFLPAGHPASSAKPVQPSRLIDKANEPAQFTRYHNYQGPALDPNNRRGGNYTQTYPGNRSEYATDPYDYQSGQKSPLEGGKQLVSGLVNPKNPLPINANSYFGRNALRDDAIGVGGGITKRFGPKADPGYESLNPQRASHVVEDLRQAPVTPGGPRDQSSIPRRIRLNNADMRKIGMSDSGKVLGVTEDAVGDYLLNRYAKSYGYDAVMPRKIGYRGREVSVPAQGRYDAAPNYTMDWGTLNRNVGNEVGASPYGSWKPKKKGSTLVSTGPVAPKPHDPQVDELYNELAGIAGWEPYMDEPLIGNAVNKTNQDILEILKKAEEPWGNTGASIGWQNSIDTLGYLGLSGQESKGVSNSLEITPTAVNVIAKDQTPVFQKMVQFKNDPPTYKDPYGTGIQPINPYMYVWDPNGVSPVSVIPGYSAKVFNSGGSMAGPGLAEQTLKELIQAGENNGLPSQQLLHGDLDLFKKTLERIQGSPKPPTPELSLPQKAPSWDEKKDLLMKMPGVETPYMNKNYVSFSGPKNTLDIDSGATEVIGSNGKKVFWKDDLWNNPTHIVNSKTAGITPVNDFMYVANPKGVNPASVIPGYSVKVLEHNPSGSYNLAGKDDAKNALESLIYFGENDFTGYGSALSGDVDLFKKVLERIQNSPKPPAK